MPVVFGKILSISRNAYAYADKFDINKRQPPCPLYSIKYPNNNLKHVCLIYLNRFRLNFCRRSFTTN